MHERGGGWTAKDFVAAILEQDCTRDVLVAKIKKVEPFNCPVACHVSACLAVPVSVESFEAERGDSRRLRLFDDQLSKRVTCWSGHCHADHPMASGDE